MTRSLKFNVLIVKSIRFIGTNILNMKYLLLLFLGGLALNGNSQTHYISLNDTTNVIRIDTFDTGIHGLDITYYFEDSLDDGTWLLHYDEDTSHLIMISTFKNQKQNGAFQAFDTDGNLSLDGFYVNDTLVHVIYYYLGHVTRECLEYGLDDLSPMYSDMTAKDFYRLEKKQCNCRSVKDGEWFYASRKTKRCFIKRLLNEQHKWLNPITPCAP
ncbi:MAG: hypothetical protein ACI8SE_001844 [Bacteroidia bacterium]